MGRIERYNYLDCKRFVQRRSKVIVYRKIKKLTEDCTIPQKAHIDDAAFDIYAAENIIVEPQKPTPVSTGFCMELPPQTEAQIRPRSGLALKHSITVLNTPGTVDAGYRGEVKVLLMNLGKEAFKVTRGMRIAQMVIAPVYPAKLVEADELSESDRGSNGFGSSGVYKTTP